MCRHAELKSTLETVLPGCKSIVCFAFPYEGSVVYKSGRLRISRYAIREDYHRVIREILKPISKLIEDQWDCRTRICVDSAPVAEKYWAVSSGLGRIGRNGLLYVEGYGSFVFLGEILSTAKLGVLDIPFSGTYRVLNLDEERTEDPGTEELCGDCRRCITACPEGAIMTGGEIDCNRCRSSLTIESSEPTLDEGLVLGNRVYGCDICQEVCPLNENRLKRELEENFFPERSGLLELRKEDVLGMIEEEFDRLFRGTPVHRLGLDRLRRNCQS